jgi:hypothetical protein
MCCRATLPILNVIGSRISVAFFPVVTIPYLYSSYESTWNSGKVLITFQQNHGVILSLVIISHMSQTAARGFYDVISQGMFSDLDIFSATVQTYKILFC